jgi:hypothetical protein
MARRPAGPPDKEKWRGLDSFVQGLYAEMDKLAKKSPREPISDLAMTRVNRAIRDAKALMKGYDEFSDDLAEFVPAGDNPEVRDAVLVLGEISAGLERLRVRYQLGYR